MGGRQSVIRRTIVVFAGTAALLLTGPAHATNAPSTAVRGTTPMAVPAVKALSGTLTADNGHTITYAIGGASPATGELAANYDGVVPAGAVVSLSGSATGGIGAGLATTITQYAKLGSQRQEFVRDVSGPFTNTLTFSLSVTAPTGQPNGSGVIDYIRVELSSRNCGGICEGVDTYLVLAVVPSGANPTPTTPTPTTPAPTPTTPTPNPPPTPPTSGDTTPPVVRLKPIPGVINKGDNTDFDFSVEDDSGKARWFTVMYSNGLESGHGNSSGLVRAKGQWRTGRWSYPKTFPGPFYTCVYALDAAGNRSIGAPYSACRWVSIWVPMSRVSNGCGGSDWGETALYWMNYFGNTRVYDGHEVPMKPACDMHDAGYAGATVGDLRTHKPINYRMWSRAEIDEKFGQDLQYQCGRYLKGAQLSAARKACLAEVATYLALVREWGVTVYDADVTTYGTQQDTPASTSPLGGGRLNN